MSLWENTRGQLSLIRQATAASPEQFSFQHALNKMAPLEGLQGEQLAVGTPNQAWLCLDLYDILCQLAEVGHHADVQHILEEPMKSCPEARYFLSTIAKGVNL